jgi:hypothetical protein
MFKGSENKLAVAKEKALSEAVADMFTTASLKGYTLIEFLKAVANLVDNQHSYEASLLIENAIAELKKRKEPLPKKIKIKGSKRIDLMAEIGILVVQSHGIHIVKRDIEPIVTRNYVPKMCSEQFKLRSCVKTASKILNKVEEFLNENN